MIHFYNDPNQKPKNKSWGQAFGEGLQSLVQHKSQQMQNKQAQEQKSSFWKQAGLSPEFANALANQPESVQKSFLDRLEGLQIPGGQQQQPQMQQQQQQPMQQGRANQFAQPAKAQAEEKALRTLQYGQEAQQLGYTPVGQQGQMGSQVRVPAIPPQLPSESPQINQGQQVPEAQGGLRLGANPLDRRQQQQMAHAEKLADKKLEQQRELAERKEKHELSKHELEKFDKEQAKSKEYLTTLNKEAKGIKENRMRLDKMEELIDTGNLSNTTFSSALDTISNGFWGVGINLKHLQSAETQEFEKLSKDMLNGLKDTFGSRILESEVQNFLQTIPSLSQSNAGKKAVIDNMRLLGEGKVLRQQTARDIIKENGNKVPADLESMVEERVEPELDALSERFKNSYHKPVKQAKSLIGSIVQSAIPAGLYQDVKY